MRFNTGYPNAMRLVSSALVLCIAMSIQCRARLAMAEPVLVGAAEANGLPRLSETKLYAERAHDCRNVDLLPWRHPTREVMIRKRIKLLALQLCNAGRYPIFHVEMPYDPQLAHNDDYFHPLYIDMLRANANWPFAFVVENSNLIVYVDYQDRTLSENLEEFRP